MSYAAIESEWLFGPGAEFEIGHIKPMILTKDSEKLFEMTGMNDEEIEKYLKEKEKNLNTNLVYVIDLYKKPIPQTDFKLKLLKGCEELKIPFDHKSVKDVTSDVIINEILQKFDSFEDEINKILRE